LSTHPALRGPLALGLLLLALATPRAARADDPAARAPRPEDPAPATSSADPLGATTAPRKDGFILDLNGGVPRLSLGGVNVVGDLAVGYQAPLGGVALAVALDAYDHVEGTAASDTRRLKINLDGWLTPGSKTLRLELRPSLAIVDYATKAIDLGADRSIFQENSLMVRIHAILGLRYTPDDDHALGVWLTGGLQGEGYESGKISESSRSGWRLSGGLNASLSGVAALRVKSYWAILPGTISTRFLADASIFHITHADGSLELATRPTPGGGTTVFLANDAFHANQTTQVDLTSRLFVDIDRLGFLGFVPGLHLGLDLFVIEASGFSTTTSVVPLAGVGLRRENF
jgi:hypothetical protein